jgi:hypothetical protein
LVLKNNLQLSPYKKKNYGLKSATVEKRFKRAKKWYVPRAMFLMNLLNNFFVINFYILYPFSIVTLCILSTILFF